jgi:hypothetical protein
LTAHDVQGEHDGRGGQGEHDGRDGQGEHDGRDGQGEHDGRDGQGEHIGSPLRAAVQWFKTMTTNEYIRGVKQNGWRPFRKKLWQRNYYEHIIRNDDEYRRIAKYIANNPANWATDALRVPPYGRRPRSP